MQEDEKPEKGREKLVNLTAPLKTVDLKVMESTRCKWLMQNGDKLLKNDSMFEKWEQFICAGSMHLYEGTCFGDSGGPGMIIRNGRYYVVGVVSYGTRCGRSTLYPDLFTRVSYFLSWIHEQMKQVG